MIDLHCHILPQLDDGPDTLIESLMMAEEAAAQGISRILCTPHHNIGKYWNPKNKVIMAVAEFQKILDENKILITLYEGQEIRISGNLYDQVQKNLLLFIDEGNKYLLIEFPTETIPVYTKKLFMNLINHGIRPIIVHPERNEYFANHLDQLADLTEIGALSQMTAPSYLGNFGSQVKLNAQKMIELGLIQLIGSDGHSINHRKVRLAEVYSELAKDYSPDFVEELKNNAETIFDGGDIKRKVHLKGD